MSGSTWGGIAGAAIGFVVSGFNPYGAYVGWMVGSAVGAYVDPTTIQGQQFQNQAIQGSQSGMARGVAFGTVTVVGCLLDGEEKPRLGTRTESAGKGGGAEIEHDTALLSYSIEICDSSELRETYVNHVIAAWEDEKLVYDVRPGAQLSWADSAKWKSNKTFHHGAEDQEPSALLEAIHGVDNVPAYRGTLRMDVDSEDLMNHGQRIPTYRFLVSVCPGVEPEPDPLHPFMWMIKAHGADTLYTSPDSDTWTDTLSPGTSAAYVDALPSGRVIAGPGRKTDNYGISWQSQTTSHTFPSYRTPSGRLISISTSSVYYSDDEWNTNTAVSVGITNLHSVAGYGSVVIAAGLSQYVVSLDGGATFESPISLGFTCSAVGCSQSGLFVFTSSFSAFRWSDDDGATLHACSGSYAECHTILPIAGGAWIAITRRNSASTTDNILRSPDGKTGWGYVTTPNCNFESSEGGRAATDGTTIIAAAESASGYLMILKSLDGQDWSEVSHGYGSTAQRGVGVSVFQAGTFSGTALPDADGYYTDIDGTITGPSLAETESCSLTLAEVCRRLYRIGAPQLDASETVLTALEDDTVRGYLVQDTSATVSVAQEPLRRIFMYDLPEHDGAIRARKRGGAVDVTVDPDDIIEGEESSITGKRGQAVEYPRKLHLSYLSPTLDYKPTTQTAERYSPDVRVFGEETLNAQIVLTDDEAAQAADRMLKVMWTEREGDQQFSLPMEYVRLVASDVIALDGRRYRVEDMRIEDGMVVIERAVYDRQSAYGSAVTGVPSIPPPAPTSSVRGPTFTALMNLPALRVEDDRPGIVVAANGYLSGWAGARIDLSRDDGTTYTTEVVPNSDGCVMGVLTAVLADASADYTDTTNTLSVQLVGNGSLETATALQVLNGANAAAILYADGTAEIIQFETATETAPRLYDLTTLQRGRLDTATGSHAIGAKFVLLNNSVRFVPLVAGDLGQEITVRTVSLGTDPEANDSYDITLTTMESQREWSVTNLTASRDGSDNVTVEWDGRPRLGTNVQPQQSSHFVGYRVTYTDGVDTFTKDVARTPLVIVGGVIVTDEITTHTYTAAEQTADFGSVPSSLDITVSAMNDITGEGPTESTSA